MGIPKLGTVTEYLKLNGEKNPDREVIVFAQSDGSRTAVKFGQLYDNASRLAKSLIKLGVNKHEIIAITLKSCPEWLYITFGAILAGARPISLSFTYKDGSDVIAMMEKLVTCSAIVLDPDEDIETWKIFQNLVKDYDDNGNVQSDLMPYLRYFICRKNSKQNVISSLTIDSMISCEHQGISLPDVQPDDIVTLFQTSGSTGIPKAVAHTNRSLIACMMSVTSTYPDEVAFTTYNDRPFMWIGGFPLNVISGETRVTRYGYSEDPADLAEFILDVVKREKCVVLGTLPPLLKSLMDKQITMDPDWPVIAVGCGGQPVSKAFSGCIGKLCKMFGCGYGATEFIVGSGIFIENPEQFQENCIGYPYKDIQMKICDDDGQTVPTNERGEIYVKSEGMFQSYYNDPERTKAAFTEDGWYKTDDIGYVTAEGLFFCVGRKSEMIISGGMNVVPSILEAVIRKCPGVANVACVPVAHDVMFQVVCACVIREDGSDITEDQLRQYCEEVHNDKPRLFTVLPAHYIFFTEFPETYSGKLSRKVLTGMVADKLLSV